MKKSLKKITLLILQQTKHKKQVQAGKAIAMWTTNQKPQKNL